MERHEILEFMGSLNLAGMRAAFDEVAANGVKRKHAMPQIIGDLLKAEIAEKPPPLCEHKAFLGDLSSERNASPHSSSDACVHQSIESVRPVDQIASSQRGRGSEHENGAT